MKKKKRISRNLVQSVARRATRTHFPCTPAMVYTAIRRGDIKTEILQHTGEPIITAPEEKRWSADHQRKYAPGINHNTPMEITACAREVNTVLGNYRRAVAIAALALVLADTKDAEQQQQEQTRQNQAKAATRTTKVKTKKRRQR